MIYETFGKLQKQFKLKCFPDVFMIFLKYSENLQKSSEVFGNIQKSAENFGNVSKVIFRCFYGFLKFLEKPSEIFRSVQKSSEISRCDQKCS